MTILSLTCQYPTNNRQWHLTINGEERDLRRRGHYTLAATLRRFRFLEKEETVAAIERAAPVLSWIRERTISGESIERTDTSVR